MKNLWHKDVVGFPTRESMLPVVVVADGMIADVRLGGGRLIPVFIIDTSTRNDIKDLISIHATQLPGDARSSWARLKKHSNYINLILHFDKPLVTAIIFEFDIVKQGILVESILESRALYLQAGKPGDKLKATLDQVRMIVEIPETGFKNEWAKIFRKRLENHYRIQGLGKEQAKESALTVISNLRKIIRARINK